MQLSDAQVEELLHRVEMYLEASVGSRGGEYDLDMVSDAHTQILVYIEQLEGEALEEVGF
jgi:hypothetical protein